jgi:hypothetical protein
MYKNAGYYSSLVGTRDVFIHYDINSLEALKGIHGLMFCLITINCDRRYLTLQSTVDTIIYHKF